MSIEISSEPLPVPGHAGFMPLPRWSETGDVLYLEPHLRGRWLIFFLAFTVLVFGVLATMLLALAAVSETFREHRTQLLRLFLLVAPALGFVLGTLASRGYGALWGFVAFDRQAGKVIRKRWKNHFAVPLSEVRGFQLCRESDGRVQLNLAAGPPGETPDRHFLFHHRNGAYLRALGERLARRCGVAFVESSH